MTERFLDFVLKEKTRNFVAFYYYFYCLLYMFQIKIPILFEIFCGIVFFICSILGAIYICEIIDKIVESNIIKTREKICSKIKVVVKEIFIFIPVWIISFLINEYILIGEPVNQTSIVEHIKESPVFYSIFVIIIGPIIEEFIFRFLPSRFIKNKILYILISGFVFAMMHVIDELNPFYYIWYYIIRAIYYGYSYKKTKDIFVPISIHVLNNLIATLQILI